jgi:hypothetical protein
MGQEVPLVIYTDEGERRVIGKAQLDQDFAYITVDEPEIEAKLRPVDLPYSIGDSSPGMAFRRVIRRPFSVEAVEVTKKNLDEIATRTGEIKETPDGRRFIETDRKLVPNVFRIYPGFWLTRLDGNLRAYSAKTFREMFEEP